MRCHFLLLSHFLFYPICILLCAMLWDLVFIAATSSNFTLRERKVRNWMEISYIIIGYCSWAFFFLSSLSLKEKSVIFFKLIFFFFGFCCCWRGCCCQRNFSLLIIWCCKNFVQMHRTFCAFFVQYFSAFFILACLLFAYT